MLFLLLFVAESRAQVPLNGKQYADSLSDLLKKPIDRIEKAKNNFLLAEYWSDKDSVQAKSYLQRGQQFSKGNEYLSALYNYYEGIILGQGQIEKAALAYQKANAQLLKFKIKEALLYQAKSWRNFAVLQKRKDDHSQYVDILLNKVIPLVEKVGDSIYLGKNYLDLAIGFKNMQDFVKAETYLLLAIKVLKENHAPAVYLAPAYHTLAENYVLTGKIKEAGPLLEQMKILLDPYPDSKLWLDYYAGQAMYLTMSAKFEQTFATLDKGILQAKKLNDSYAEQRLLLQKFYALYNHKDFVQAREVLLGLMQRKEIMSLATNRVQIYYGLAYTYADLKDMPNAFTWMKKYSELSDSLSQSKIKKDINALEIKYRNAENQKKIAKLQLTTVQNELSLKNNRLINWLLGSISVLLLTIAVFSFFQYRNKKRLAEQKIKDIVQLQELMVMKAILQGEEKERNRVARDLHDGLGGLLAGAKLSLSAISTNQIHDGQVGGQLDKVINQLDVSVKELRRVSRNLMPETLTKFGLDMAINELCESLSKEDLTISYQSFEVKKTISTQVQVHIYRIVQELLTNAVRHAKAKQIVLQCSQNGDRFFISIEDNGVGFDANSVKQGMGLSNIQNRVKYLKGSFEINATKEKGTSIHIELSVA